MDTEGCKKDEEGYVSKSSEKDGMKPCSVTVKQSRNYDQNMISLASVENGGFQKRCRNERIMHA